jgi:putative hemolysin
MVEAVFDFGDKSARALMTPRNQIVWLQLNENLEKLSAKLSDSGHSRFPVAMAASTMFWASSTPKICYSHSYRLPTSILKRLCNPPTS